MGNVEHAPRHRKAVAPRVSVVIPALNESLNLAALLPRLPEVHEVILVDGGSVDGTVGAARRVRPDVVVVEQSRTGKGNALAAGFAAVTGDIVVTLDADGSADPAEIPAFVGALVDGADIAKGTRFAAGGASSDITLVRRAGNRFLGTVFNVLFGTRHSDLCYGFNAFWADLVPLLDLPDQATTEERRGDGFEIETIISCRFAAAGVAIAEVPSVEHRRLFGESHLHAVRDGLRVLVSLVSEWRRSLRAATYAPKHRLAPAPSVREYDAVPLAA